MQSSGVKLADSAKERVSHPPKDWSALVRAALSNGAVKVGGPCRAAPKASCLLIARVLEGRNYFRRLLAERHDLTKAVRVK